MFDNPSKETDTALVVEGEKSPAVWEENLPAPIVESNENVLEKKKGELEQLLEVTIKNCKMCELSSVCFNHAVERKRLEGEIMELEKSLAA